jgi:hypothetical protein
LSVQQTEDRPDSTSDDIIDTLPPPEGLEDPSCLIPNGQGSLWPCLKAFHGEHSEGNPQVRSLERLHHQNNDNDHDDGEEGGWRSDDPPQLTITAGNFQTRVDDENA